MSDIIWIMHYCFKKKKEENDMCNILSTLHGQTPSDILNKYGNTNHFPVDIVNVARKIGIKLGSIDFLELEKTEDFKKLVEKNGHILGAVFTNGNDLFITYHNALHKDVEKHELTNLSVEEKRQKLICRQRFTIAHEIAHCCLHMDPCKDKMHIEYRTEQSDGNSSREREANIFAGELLIPKDILIQICVLFNNTISISKFAELFMVSKKVMRARVEYLQEQGYLLGINIK